MATTTEELTLNPPSEVTRLLGELESGDVSAAEKLLALLYEELRAIAARKMSREGAGHTLQPTALVHEAWIRFTAIPQIDVKKGWRSAFALPHGRDEKEEPQIANPLEAHRSVSGVQSDSHAFG